MLSKVNYILSTEIDIFDFENIEKSLLKHKVKNTVTDLLNKIYLFYPIKIYYKRNEKNNKNNKNRIIELNFSDNKIESYKMDEAIDLKNLIEFLLKDELKTIFEIENLIDNPTDSEKDLIELIMEVIKKYNSKKNEMDKFILSQKEQKN